MIIPNGYVYTSHTGSKYVFLEGCWFNSSTLQLIDISKYEKMNKSAMIQINESNSKSKFKIGKSYVHNSQNIVYLGEGIFNTGKGFLSESILCEDDTTEVPIGYVIKSNKGNLYKKTPDGWLNTQSKKILNSSASNSVSQAAKKEIDIHNSTNAVKIGTKVKSKSGKEYTYVGGDRFVADDGKLIPQNNAKTILDRLSSSNSSDSTDDVQNNTSDNTTEQNSNNPEQTNDNSSEGSAIESLAKRIKSSPEGRKIEILLNRGDKISLLAADILLAGTQEETLNILKSLNTGNN